MQLPFCLYFREEGCTINIEKNERVVPENSLESFRTAAGVYKFYDLPSNDYSQ